MFIQAIFSVLNVIKRSKSHFIFLFYSNPQHSSPLARYDNYGNENSNALSASNGLADGVAYMQEKMSSLFLETGYENIYLAIGVAATALFVIETLVRVYRIYEANNKRRKRRKRSNTYYPEDIEKQFEHIIIGIINGYDVFKEYPASKD